MKNSNRLASLACGVALASAALLCSCASIAGGDATETGNARISGRIVDTQGLSVQNARVQLLPDFYDPVRDGKPSDSSAVMTDESGNYTIHIPGHGRYTIEAILPATGDRALVSGIGAFGNETVIVPDATIRRPGAIKVLLLSPSASAYVYLPGTTRFGRFAGDAAIIDSVPAGSFSALYYIDQADTARNRSIKTNFTVAPGSTAIVSDNQAWGFSKTIYLNTTASGAAIGGNVYSFPVLVRLSANNFVFSQAKSDGGDLRFAKSNGTPLPCEIERWDAAGQRAEVWVKVDTVYGNDSAQSLTMYWGASAGSAAMSLSNGPAVFDTANGFQGVWHLSEAGSAIAKDATGNHYDGTPSDTAPAGAEGTIGPCRSFNGSSNCIRMKNTANSKLNFPENGTFTISAWVYVDTLDNGYHLIAGKSNEQYYLKFKLSNPSIPNSPMVWEFVEYHDKAGYNITNSLPSVPSAKAWSYLVGVQKGTQQYFYINGDLVDSTPSFNSWAVPRNTGDDVTIGKFMSQPADTTTGKCPFLGKIDEVRISNAAYNADWIKLCYRNQKEPDALVKW